MVKDRNIVFNVICHLDLPYGEHIEVAFHEGKALVFCTGQPKAKRQNWECEGEEASDDKKQRPQSKTEEKNKQTNMLFRSQGKTLSPPTELQKSDNLLVE